MTFSSLAASLNTRFFTLRLKIPIETEIFLIEAQYLSSATWQQVIALETSSRAREYPTLRSQQGQVETEKLRAYL